MSTFGPKVRARRVYEVYEHSNECRALEVTGQDWSSEVVSLFLEDWELARVALSCHMALDLLCQEMRDACQDRSKLLGSQSSLCSQCLDMQEWQLAAVCAALCHSRRKPFSHRGRTATARRRRVV